MGSSASKNLKEPTIIVGSTVIQGECIMILDDKLFLPISDNKESSVIEVDLKEKKYSIIRGFHGKLHSSMLKRESNKNIERFSENSYDL